jgi:hypothetical protein
LRMDRWQSWETDVSRTPLGIAMAPLLVLAFPLAASSLSSLSSGDGPAGTYVGTLSRETSTACSRAAPASATHLSLQVTGDGSMPERSGGTLRLRLRLSNDTSACELAALPLDSHVNEVSSLPASCAQPPDGMPFVAGYFSFGDHPQLYLQWGSPDLAGCNVTDNWSLARR